jgi:two-component system response regulator FixJ
MAPMDGITFLKNIREKGNSVPFIIITGHSNIGGYIETVQKFGALEYIQKPVELEMLDVVVERLLGGQAQNG